MVENYACRLMGATEVAAGIGFFYLGSGNASDPLNFNFLFNGLGAGLGAAGFATLLLPEVERFSNYVGRILWKTYRNPRKEVSEDISNSGRH